MGQAFGDPKSGPADLEDGGKLGGCRLASNGGGIQFGYDAKRTQVIAIRPLTKRESGNAMMKAIQDERFWKGFSA